MTIDNLYTPWVDKTQFVIATAVGLYSHAAQIDSNDVSVSVFTAT
jgi:hypothetical protein